MRLSFILAMGISCLMLNLVMAEEEQEGIDYITVEVIQGDMIMYYKKDINSSDTRAGAVGTLPPYRNQTWRWPTTTIPYQFDRVKKPSEPHRKKILQGMRDIENAVPNCVKFRPVESGDKWFTTIKSGGNGCSSSRGLVENNEHQSVNLAEGCGPGNVVHELLHTLGFGHEQARNDRDWFVDIKWENIKKGAEVNYNKDKDADYQTSYYDVRYNYDSIMQYPEYAGSQAIDQNKPVFVSKHNKTAIGYDRDLSEQANRQFLSEGDLQMLAKHMGCKIPSHKTFPITGANPNDSSDLELPPPSGKPSGSQQPGKQCKRKSK